MSYRDQSGSYPPPHDQSESQYPPPGEEDDRAKAYYPHVPSSRSVTLPSISQYDPQYAPPPSSRDDRGYQQDYSRGGPQQMAFILSAPRQRTAIACRYCRRRKVKYLQSTLFSRSATHNATSITAMQNPASCAKVLIFSKT
jgi:hypothetical protein